MNYIANTTRTFALILLVLIGASVAPQTALAGDYEGNWTKRSQTIKGGWSIVETAEGRFLQLDEGFKTRRAPDLKLFLSKRDAADVTANNATDGSVLIAPLKKSKGAQRYALPADLDLSEFNTLVLHCEQYTKLWGVSALSG
ncbi:MAG: DM13 domain-containing protein [Pseudomonadota bacterium]